MPHHPTRGSGPNLFGPMVPGKEPTSITAIGIKATGIESDPVAIYIAQPFDRDANCNPEIKNDRD
jgi:hypothetical protein